MRLLIILLLTSSCASYQGAREYSQVTHYKVKGVKCPLTHYFDYDTQSCLPDSKYYINASDNPSGVSIDLKRTHIPSPDRRIALNAPVLRKKKAKAGAKTKINCKVILDNINKCSL